MRNMFYVDMHCHPGIKPYSWYIHDEGKENTWHCRNLRTSLWYNDPPTERDKRRNKRIGLTKFTQSDFRSLRKGDVRIISACLGPVERNLFIPQGPAILNHFCILRYVLKGIGFLLIKFIIETSLKYIWLARRKNRDYFTELEKEYNFFKQEQCSSQNLKFPTIFELTSDFSQIDLDIKGPAKDKIYLFFSIEGCHVFNNGGLNNSFSKQEVLDNIKKVKEKWYHPPLYVSMAHHIYNELCGHARSLPPLVRSIINQKEGMNKAFTPLGREVMHKLLEKDPRRIYIDIKHMSTRSRYEYYYILNHDNRYAGQCIPVFASHGAVNGLPSLSKWVQKNYRDWVEENFSEAVVTNLAPEDYQTENKLQFNQAEINFFDDEIDSIQRTGGFLGIQLDERILCSPKQKRLNKRKSERGPELIHQAGLVWKQIRYIAEHLDRNGKYGWGTAALGSDYDGAVDPPNGYYTSEDFGILEENLIIHADKYFLNYSRGLKQAKNKPAPSATPDQAKVNAHEMAQEVIDLFMRGNAIRFLRKFYQFNVKEVKDHSARPKRT